MLPNFVSAAIAIIAFLLIPAPVNNNQVQQGAINTDILDKIIPNPAPAKEPAATQPAAPKKEVKEAAYEVEPQPVAEDSENYYCIVLASKITKNNATIYAQKLRDQGYDKAEAFVRKNGAKVIYGHYKTENDAYNALNGMSDNAPFTEGWVMHVK